MVKVHILIPCSHCKGQAYLPFEEAESYTGDVYTRYLPCTACQGSGKQEKWVSLPDFTKLLSEANETSATKLSPIELAADISNC